MARKQRLTRNVRRWAPWALLGVALFVIVSLVLRDIDLDPAWSVVKQIAPVGAVVIALSSFIVLATSSWSNWKAARNQATLEAWTDWSDRCTDARRLLTITLGLKAISDEQAKSLATTGAPLNDLAGKPVPNAEKQAVMDAMMLLLNGLERLAVGVDLGVYKRDVLIAVGGTIIKRCYERFEPYVELRRTLPDRSTRQERAFIELERLVSQIKFSEVDSQRLKALERA